VNFYDSYIYLHVRNRIIYAWLVFKSVPSFVIIEIAMNQRILPNIIERADLRERSYVFRDRAHAGEVLAEMLDAYRRTDVVVLAVPAGGSKREHLSRSFRS